MAKKIQIYPSKDAKQKLLFISHLCIDLYNAALEQRRDRKTWGKENWISQKKQLPIIKKEFDEYKIPSSQVLQNVIIRLDKSYKSFFKKRKNGDKEARPPKFKSKKYFYTQEYSQPNTSFEITKNGIRLAYGKNKKEWINIDLNENDLKELLAFKMIKTIQIHQKKNTNKWFASITYHVEEPQHI